MLSRRALLTLVLGCTAAALPATAGAAIDRAARIAEIDAYLNSVKTVRARFLQVSSDGQTAEGTVYISRPGHMRLEYAPPVPLLIVADGTFLIVNDTKLDQVSYIPLGSTPAGILLQPGIDLDGGDVAVTQLSEDAGTLRVTVVRRESPTDGNLTLVFDTDPLTLRRWEIVDAQSITTQVTLVSAVFNQSLDDSLFRFKNPRIFREKLN